jgi:membrane protease YdiL (CAAX protease family)
VNHQVAVREIGAYLALVTSGSVVVAMALPRSGAAPALSAIIPVAVLIALTPVRGRATWSNLGLARAGIRRWPVALAVPTAIAVFVYGIGLLTGVLGAGAYPSLAVLGSVLTNIALGSILVLGEEVGWRGFLLSRLHLIMPPRRAALIVGLVHAVIHLPLVLLTTTYNSQGSRWIVAPLTVVTITAAGVFYAWLRDSSGSLWPAAIAHSAGNTLIGWIMAAASPGQAASAAQLVGEGGVLPAAGMSAVAVLLLVRSRTWRRRTEVRGGDLPAERASAPLSFGGPLR